MKSLDRFVINGQNSVEELWSSLKLIELDYSFEPYTSYIYCSPDHNMYFALQWATQIEAVYQQITPDVPLPEHNNVS